MEELRHENTVLKASLAQAEAILAQSEAINEQIRAYWKLSDSDIIAYLEPLSKRFDVNIKDMTPLKALQSIDKERGRDYGNLIKRLDTTKGGYNQRADEIRMLENQLNAERASHKETVRVFNNERATIERRLDLALAERTFVNKWMSSILKIEFK